jgi:hypothetical protein
MENFESRGIMRDDGGQRECGGRISPQLSTDAQTLLLHFARADGRTAECTLQYFLQTLLSLLGAVFGRPSRMAHTFEMKNRDPTVRRLPMGHCIYCDSPDYRAKKDRKLAEEHVVAEGLGGSLVLREAVCEECEIAITRFEPAILRTVLYAPRVHLGIRRKKRKRSEETIKIQGKVNDKDVEVDLPLARVPVVLFFVLLESPEILIDRPANFSPMRGAWFIHLNADKVLTPAGFQSFASPVLDTFKFSQFLAKIAHGFAVDAFGDYFVPFLREIIRDKQLADQRYDLVGGKSEAEAASANLHELSAEWRVVNDVTYAVVRIRLFANLGAPTYFVVAGRLKAA